MFFDLEYSTGCTKDYLKIYDSDIANMGPSNLIGTYCGTRPNFTTATQRYLTLEFHTDGSGTGKGFRFRGTRTEPRKFNFVFTIGKTRLEYVKENSILVMHGHKLLVE